jgi:hypothetical protein
MKNSKIKSNIYMQNGPPHRGKRGFHFQDVVDQLNLLQQTGATL